LRCKSRVRLTLRAAKAKLPRRFLQDLVLAHSRPVTARSERVVRTLRAARREVIS